MVKKICILAMGGTMDKDHDPISEGLIFSEHSHLRPMLEEFRIHPKPDHEIIMLKDSFDIDDQDRETIKNAVLARKEQRIIITHGTSTMSETAQYLAKNIIGKTVVLTGAMRPFSLFRSDAGFNLGTAMGAVQTLDNGVYIAMNGKIFDAKNVQKNVEKGLFEEAG